MLPRKRRKKVLIIGLISLVCLIIIIILIATLTKAAHNNKIETIVSDPYPEEVNYLAIFYDEENEYYNIIALDNNFKTLDYSLRSFYQIKDYNVANQKLYVYTDAINEVAYLKKDNQFSFNEINSYFNKEKTVKLTKDYYVIKDQDKLSYNLIKEEKEEKQIADTLIADIILAHNNTIYYFTKEGLVSYDLESNQRKLLQNFAMYNNFKLALYNNYLLYLTSDTHELIYSLADDKTFYKEDFIEDNAKVLALYDTGLVYQINNTLYFYDLVEKYTFSYEIKGELKKVYNVNNNYFYLEIRKDDQDSYLLYNPFNKRKIELDKRYLNIIRVK